jgi:hypothetical protein
MVERLTRELIAEQAIIHEAPLVRQPAAVDRNFELPGGLYAATGAAYLAFVGVMAFGFGNPGLVVPMAIIVVFIAMFFAVPAMWMRMKPDHAQHLTPWARFQRQGVMTAFGHSSAGAASVQVLILPALILVWGLAVVIIAALVR